MELFWYLPEHPWQRYKDLLKQAIENQEQIIGDEFEFLRGIGFLRDDLDHSATDLGKRYYDATYIKNDDAASTTILAEALLSFAPIEALIQLLHGVKNATRDNALAVLKSRGYWRFDDEKPLTHLLNVLNTAGLVTYSKKHRTLKVLHNPHDPSLAAPSSMFVDPATPYSNIQWLRKILRECNDHIYWLDKHFLKKGLEFIWEVADANKVREIVILSISLREHDKSTTKEYRKLKDELSQKGISLKWMIIDSKLIRDTHDRWILSKDGGWNVPDISTIVSGSRSEIHKSSNLNDVERAFLGYKKLSKELGT